MAHMARHMLQLHKDTIPPHLLPVDSEDDPAPNGSAPSEEEEILTLEQIEEKWTGSIDDPIQKIKLTVLSRSVEMSDAIAICTTAVEEVDFSRVQW
jgi:hypothetical protein